MNYNLCRRCGHTYGIIGTTVFRCQCVTPAPVFIRKRSYLKVALKPGRIIEVNEDPSDIFQFVQLWEKAVEHKSSLDYLKGI